MESKIFNLSLPLKITVAMVIGFWCLIAVFPLLWVLVMSIKLPVDSFASNPLEVIFGPATKLQVGGLSIINLLGDIEWTHDNLIRKKLEPSLSNSDFYLRPNEFMYINMVMDSVSGTSFSDSGEPSMYYEMYKVVLFEEIDNIEIDSTDLEYIVNYGDSYLLPSGSSAPH